MKMENVGAISEVEWNNYGGIYSSSNNEEADFMAQLLLDNENPNNSMFLGSCNNSSNDNTNNDNDVTNNMFFYFSNNSNNYNSSGHNNEIIYPIRSDESFVFEGGNNSKDDNFVESGDNFLVQELSNDSSKGDEDVDDHHQNGYYLGISLQLGMEHDHHQLDLPLHHHSQDEKLRCPKDNVPNKKRPPPHGYKNKRNVKPRKNQRAALLSSGNIGENENDSNTNNNNNNNNNSALVLQRQNSSMSYFSEDDTNASLESNGGGTTTTTTTSSTSERGGATNQTNGKTRASRGSATDPQSLYARKRREKINERLRILQNLVPNGTKVDISTMLEEAVQYVKFLQLQIKLLSSDDLWMYSPIAYNGMDMGLDLKIASHDL